MLDLLSTLTHNASTTPTSLAARSLEAVRNHLGMDIAYVSEFVEDRTVFRVVDAPGLEHLLAPGDSKGLEEVYCRHILEGRLPELITDTALLPLAMSMPITHDAPIGAHVSVPIRKADGQLYGMFCCLSASSRPSLNERDLHIVRAFAGLVAEDLARDTVMREELETQTKRVRAALADPGAVAIHLQPIRQLIDGATVGYEALARFEGPLQRTPDLWFAEAAHVGLGAELELKAIEAALAVLSWLPAPLTISINASPATVGTERLAQLLSAAPRGRVVLEMTEHAIVEDYHSLCERLDTFRALGVALAIDDAGAGFSGLQHIIRLRPEIIKLDMSLIRDVDSDPARRALAGAMQTFARQTDAVLVAEGIETDAELAVLKALTFSRGQGYLLGRPAPCADVRSWLTRADEAQARTG